MLARQSRPRLWMPCWSIQAGSVRTDCSSAEVRGFSTNPWTRPVSSAFMMPNDDACLRSTGSAAMVTWALDC